MLLFIDNRKCWSFNAIVNKVTLPMSLFTSELRKSKVIYLNLRYSCWGFIVIVSNIINTCASPVTSFTSREGNFTCICICINKSVFQLTPQLVRPLVYRPVKQVSCGDKHSLFLFQDLTLAAVG